MSDDIQIPAGYKLVKDTDLTTLQASYKLLNDLWDNPEHGATVKRAAKAVNPALRVPEIDVAEPLLKPLKDELSAKDEEIKKIREEFEADRKARQDDRDLDDLKTKLAKAQKDHRLTDEGMAEVKKIMAERGVADPDIAAKYVAANIEPAKPVRGSNFGPTDANIFGIDGKSAEDDIKALHQDPLKWMDKAVPEIMAEFEQDAA